MIAQERLPALRPPATLQHVFGHCGLSDLKAQHQQLAMDPRRSPGRVLSAHLRNELTQAAIDARPPCSLSRLPAPESLEASPVPAKNGLRLYDLRQPEQARPEPDHPDQQR